MPSSAARRARLVLASVAVIAFAAPALAQDAAPQQPTDPIVLAPADPNTVVVRPDAPDVAPPDGDPRGPNERRRDRLAWDKCVRRAERAENEIGRANPVADTPEEICSRKLGMADRNAVPISRY